MFGEKEWFIHKLDDLIFTVCLKLNILHTSPSLLRSNFAFTLPATTPPKSNASMLALVVLASLVSYFLARLYHQRAMFKNLPGPPHHAIWGHFLIMREIASSLPHDATPQLFAHLMREKYGLGDFFYLDLWPLAPPQLVIAHPSLATQIVHKMNLPKESAIMQKWTGPILGEKSMVSANGHDWFLARKSFTPGFQPRKLLNHVPNIVDEAQAFANVLREHAQKSDIFRMEDLSARMIFNISTWVIL